MGAAAGVIWAQVERVDQLAGHDETEATVRGGVGCAPSTLVADLGVQPAGRGERGGDLQAAVGAGLGVALMTTLGQTPEMLVVRDDLPRPEPIPLTVRHRPGLAGEIPRRAAAALRRLLVAAVATPNLAKGA